MPRRRTSRKRKPRKSVSLSQQAFTLLDRFSAKDLEKWGALQERILRFHWDYYQNLAFQRSQVADQIKSSLLEPAGGPFDFSKWQRIVKYKYSLEPLSVEGSIVDPGGRFNIGDINPRQFPIFPALYIASDRETALQEMLCQKIEEQRDEQRALDFALANPTSVSSVSVSGHIETYIDLREPEVLKDFVGHIKHFTLPGELIKDAKEIGFDPPRLIKNVTELLNELSRWNWRDFPMLFDVPSTSQIFGQLVADAGIEGIVYQSKFNNRDCLVMFPQNLEEGSDSHVQLDDEPPAETTIRRLDADSWRQTSSG